MSRLLLAALIILTVATVQGCAWEYATEVPMTVRVLPAQGVEPVSIECTGRIRYDRYGRIHIIGGIGPPVRTVPMVANGGE